MTLLRYAAASAVISIGTSFLFVVFSKILSKKLKGRRENVSYNYSSLIQLQSSQDSEYWPSPGTMSNAELFQFMLERNRLFVDETFFLPDLSAKRRRNIADNGQFPQVAIVSCADSRVPPEYLFGAGIGDLFLVRLAGNAVDRVGLGALEFAVEALNVRLIIVLGHSQCGAISEAVRVAQKSIGRKNSVNCSDFPHLSSEACTFKREPQSSLWSLIESVYVPVRETVDSLPSDDASISDATIVDEAVISNVKYQADVIWNNSSVIRNAVENKSVLIKCARSFIRTGQVFDVPYCPSKREDALFSEPGSAFHMDLHSQKKLNVGAHEQH